MNQGILDRALRGAIVCATLWLGGCGGDAAPCTTGETNACLCTPTVSGLQVCQADGTYGSCTCGNDAGAEDGGGGGDGGDDGGGAMVDASTTDAGPDSCACVWPSRIDHPDGSLSLVALTSMGDLVYVVRPSRSTGLPHTLNVRECATGLDRVLSLAEPIPGAPVENPSWFASDLIAYSQWEDPRGVAVWWSLSTEAVVGIQEFDHRVTVGAVDGRGHSLVWHLTPSSTCPAYWTEHDPTGELVADYQDVITDCLVLGPVPLLEGWAIGLERDGDLRRIANGMEDPLSAPFIRYGSMFDRARRPWGRFFFLDEPAIFVRGGINSWSYREEDAAGTTIWQSDTIDIQHFGTSSGTGGCRPVVVDALGGFWGSCTDTGASAFVDTAADGLVTGVVVRYDGTSGAELSRDYFPTVDDLNASVSGPNLLPDACGNVYARSYGERWDYRGAYVPHYIIEKIDHEGNRLPLSSP